MGRIVRVEVGRLDYALVGEFKFFKGAARATVLVRLVDDAGAEGWGQAVPVETWTYETVETVETTLRNYLAPAILGADSADLADVHARMERAIRPSFSVGQPLCKAAIDLACYDLWGKRAGKSVATLLGGVKRSEITLSWTVNATTLAKRVRFISWMLISWPAVRPSASSRARSRLAWQPAAGWRGRCLPRTPSAFCRPRQPGRASRHGRRESG